jgi:UDP-N-acetylglucosamine 2-epimerase (non-hydrolysing)
MEAGNRCFDQRVPEELNRKVLDHLSDINLVLTEHARRYLIAEGIPPETIIKTGSHMDEVLDYYKDKYTSSNILNELDLQSRKYFIVSTHREENVDSDTNLKDLMNTLESIAKKYNLPVIVSLHPRTAKRIEALNLQSSNPLIKFMKPFGLMDYLKLQIESKCVISDSGTITEESSLLNLPAITIRNAHERPEGMDEGTLIMTGLKEDKVLEAIDVVDSQFNEDERVFPIITDYESKIVSKKITRIVLSYIDYINRTVWSK